jgi:hypothetical protein
MAARLQIAIRESVREVLSEDKPITPPSKDHIEKTVQLAAKQRSKPLPKGGKLAEARQQVHTSGTSEQKVFRNRKTRWVNPKKCKGTRALDRREKMLQKRKDQSPMGYEGLLDFSIRHIFSMEKDAFTLAVTRIIDTIRCKINNTKSLVELMLGFDSDIVVRYLISTVCCIVCAVFAHQYNVTKSWVALVFAGISGCAAIYVSHKDLFRTARDWLVEYVRRNYAGEFTVEEDDTVDQMEDCIRRFLDKKDATQSDDGSDDDFHTSSGSVGYESGDWLLQTAAATLGDLMQAIMVGGVGFAVFRKQGRLVENLAKVPRIAEGISGLIELVMKWGASLLDAIFNTKTSEYFAGNEALDKWAREVMELANEHDAGKLALSATSSMAVLKLVQRGRDLATSKLITTHYGTQVFRTAMREAERLQLCHSRVGLGVETKPEAFAVLLMGESGVGKSFITQRLMKFLGLRLMPKGRRERFFEDYHSEVWPFCIEEEHANGYRGQFFTVMDDLGQQKPAPGAKTEGIATVRFVNPVPAKLNMAALHEKGNVSFTSEFIFGSTNLYRFWDLQIAQPEAFLRRWSHIVIMAPKRSWCTPETRDGTLKERRLDRSLLTGEFNPDVSEFHIQRWTDISQQKMETCEILDFQEFEDKLVRDYQAHCERTADLHKSIHAQAAQKLADIQAEEDRLGYEGWLGPFGKKETLDERFDREYHAMLQRRMNAVKGTRKMTWSEWWSKTTLSEKAASLCTRTKQSARRTTRLTTGYLQSWRDEVVYQWQELMSLGITHKTEILRFIVMLVTVIKMLEPIIMPPIRKALDCIRGWFGKAKRDTGMPADFVFHDIHDFVQFGVRDQGDMLENECGVDLSNNMRTANVKHIVDKILREMVKNKWKEYPYFCLGPKLKGKKAKYVLEQKYESWLFAAPRGETRFDSLYIGSVFRRNVYHMYNEKANPFKDDSAGKVTFVKGKLMLMNKHFIHQIKAKASAGVVSGNLHFVPHGRPDKVVRIPLQHFLDPANIAGMDSSEDVVLVNCGPYVADHADIVDKFVREAEGAALQDHAFSVYLPPRPDYMKQHDVVGSFTSTAKVMGNTHRGMFWYWADTQNGDCGGLLVDHKSGNPARKLVGIHAAGDKYAGKGTAGIAFAQRVCQEHLVELCSKFDTPIEARSIDEDADYEASNFMSLDVVKTDTKTNIIVTKSALKPSYMHGWAGAPTRVPAPLAPFTNSNGEYLVPLHIALSGEHANNVPVDPRDVDAAVYFVTKRLLQVCRNRGKVLSTAEGILGVPGTALKPIQRATSAGYYGLHNPGVKPGKRGALGTDGDYTLNAPEALKLIAAAETQWEGMKNGKPSESPYLLFLKDEKRSLSKVEAGKARLVKAASVDEVINIRRLYGTVVADLMEHHTVSGITVGINPLGPQWDFLARDVTRKGNKVIAGDFSGFDQSQSGQLLRAVMHVLQNLAGHTDPAIRRVEHCVAETLAAPRCMVGDLIYQNDHGLPSGNPLTSIMNSIFSLLTFQLLWLKIMRKEGETRTEALTRYESEVETKVYGDDNVLNVSDAVAEEYNMDTLRAAAPSIGVKYTDADKEDQNPPKYRTLTEISFLKRAFRWESRVGRYVAPLDLQTLLEVSYYTKDKGSGDAITRTNVERTFRELALHGEEVYNEWSSKMVEEHNRRTRTPLTAPPFQLALEEVTGEEGYYFDPSLE